MADVTFPRHHRDDGAFRGVDETLGRVLKGPARFVGERARPFTQWSGWTPRLAEALVAVAEAFRVRK